MNIDNYKELDEVSEDVLSIIVDKNDMLLIIKFLYNLEGLYSAKDSIPDLIEHRLRHCISIANKYIN